jgi:guanosine-3',5'-bis(diphosphate) 3'-pyrophosphohydrolase
MNQTDLILQKVEAFANDAHGSQTRRYSPDPYMVHPVRVMQMCRDYLPQLPVLAAALLHDVLEDTPVNEEQLSSFLSHEMTNEDATLTMKYVVELTDIYTKQNYPQWNRRKRRDMEMERLSVTSGEAQTIKYADIIDNSGDITVNDPDFARVFLNESWKLLQKIDRGHPQLHQRAIDTVSICLQRIKSQTASNDRATHSGEKG